VFKEALTDLQQRVEGTLAVSLMGLDGIAIDSVNRGNIPLENLGAEFGSMIKSIRASNTEINAGEFQQFSVVTDKYIIVLAAVTSEYFILMVMSPTGNYGKARFELTKAKYALQDELV
jgi:predicted regulator of Ras-like GTPase activity (Roadblock/LC7/MglB family)